VAVRRRPALAGEIGDISSAGPAGGWATASGAAGEDRRLLRRWGRSILLTVQSKPLRRRARELRLDDWAKPSSITTDSDPAKWATAWPTPDARIAPSLADLREHDR
jgi:hypothetical protein